ncbi:MAG: type II toxin-antitoxin system Phd/YefM family antitoxin [Actinomycetota bacterium]
MATVNIHDAKTHFSRLVDRVLQGEEVVIAKAGRPVARLVPLPPRVPRRTPGSARGLIEIGPDFDEPLPDDIRFE